jgi:hypothetical protein
MLPNIGIYIQCIQILIYESMAGALLLPNAKRKLLPGNLNKNTTLFLHIYTNKDHRQERA